MPCSWSFSATRVGRKAIQWRPPRAHESGTRTLTPSRPGRSTWTRIKRGLLEPHAPPAVLAVAPGVCEVDCSGDDAVLVSLSSRRSASSGEIFPAASNSRTFFVSADISFSFLCYLQTLTEPLQGLVDAQLTACELLEDVNIWRGRVEILVECGGDGVQAVLHRRVADIKERLHFLERAVVTHEGDHKCLVVERELGQRRDLEFAVHGDAALGAGRLAKLERLLAIGAYSLRNIQSKCPLSEYLYHRA